MWHDISVQLLCRILLHYSLSKLFRMKEAPLAVELAVTHILDKGLRCKSYLLYTSHLIRAGVRVYRKMHNSLSIRKAAAQRTADAK